MINIAGRAVPSNPTILRSNQSGDPEPNINVETISFPEPTFMYPAVLMAAYFVPSAMLLAAFPVVGMLVPVTIWGQSTLQPIFVGCFQVRSYFSSCPLYHINLYHAPGSCLYHCLSQPFYSSATDVTYSLDFFTERLCRGISTTFSRP